jgi:hypothetical protein
MKILLNDGYEEVGFWSFMKCSFLTSLALTGIIYGVLIFLFILIGMAE